MVGYDYYDRAANTTHQLDYYVGRPELIKPRMIKKYNGLDTMYWLRSADSSISGYFRVIDYYGYLNNYDVDYTIGLAPVFRIG